MQAEMGVQFRPEQCATSTGLGVQFQPDWVCSFNRNTVQLQPDSVCNFIGIPNIVLNST